MARMFQGRSVNVRPGGTLGSGESDRGPRSSLNYPLSNLPTTPSASPLACPRSGSRVNAPRLSRDSLVPAAEVFKCGSIGSDPGPDPEADVGVEFVAVVCVSVVKVRKGEGATRGRWKR